MTVFLFKKLTTLLKPIRELDLVTKCFFVLLATLGIRPILDPDFGWHFRDGLDIIQTHKGPYLDPCSYTMPDWKWVNHEWLTDVLMTILHGALTPLGLSIIFGLV